MKELSPEARALIAHERSGEPPTEADADRVWSGVVRELETPPPPAAAAPAHSLHPRLLMLGAAAVIVSGTIALLTSRRQDPSMRIRSDS
jgi:hypothetical protein